MKRFITYLSAYVKGVKGRSVGFVKTDLRDNWCQMEVHIQSMGRFQGKARVYLLIGDERVKGLLLGVMQILQGRGDFRTKLAMEPLDDTMYSFRQVVGVGVCFGDYGYAAGSWVDAPGEGFREGNFEIVEKESDKREESLKNGKDVLEKGEKSNRKNEEDAGETEGKEDRENEEDTQETAGKEHRENEEEARETDKKAEQEVVEEAWETDKKAEKEIVEAAQRTEETKDFGNEEEQTPAEISYERIDLAGLQSLPKKYAYLCTNSFILQSYLRYHYLVIKREVTKQGETKYIGVPGVFARRERATAMLFGFHEFDISPEQRTMEEQKYEGQFGYWLYRMDE